MKLKIRKKTTKFSRLFLLFVALNYAVGMAQPLLSLYEGKHLSKRSLRYTPDGEDFVIVNGKNKFNRALYGSHSGFRLETGMFPNSHFIYLEWAVICPLPFLTEKIPSR